MRSANREGDGSLPQTPVTCSHVEAPKHINCAHPQGLQFKIRVCTACVLTCNSTYGVSKKLSQFFLFTIVLIVTCHLWLLLPIVKTSLASPPLQVIKLLLGSRSGPDLEVCYISKKEPACTCTYYALLCLTGTHKAFIRNFSVRLCKPG